MSERKLIEEDKKSYDETIIFSCDAGRSGIKYAWVEGNERKTNIFANKFGFANFNYLKTVQVLFFHKDKDIIAKVDNVKPIIVGDTCDSLLPPEDIICATNDESYLAYSVYYTLISIAKTIDKPCNVVLSINLTFNNNVSEEDLRNKLMGEHNVKFYDPKGNVYKDISFNVVKIPVASQGWSTLMYRALDKDLNLDENFIKSGIVIDIGRKTTDVILVQKFTPAKGKSYEIATDNIFTRIKDKLLETHKIKKENSEIELLIKSGESIKNRITGESIELKEFLIEAISSSGVQLLTRIRDDFGNYSPSWVLLTGGGSIYYKETLSKAYNSIELMEVVDDYIFSNALGMLKFMQKYSRY